MERSDAEVVAASLDDPPAFTALFDRHAGLLFRFLVRRVGPDVGDDLAPARRTAGAWLKPGGTATAALVSASLACA